MTEYEALIVQYLRRFAGQWVRYCRMLNNLTAAKLASEGGLETVVSRERRRQVWLAFRNSANRLVVDGVVIRRYLKSDVIGQRGPQQVRLHAAYEQNPVL